jgi:hypothetical protein
MMVRSANLRGSFLEVKPALTYTANISIELRLRGGLPIKG